ncbi:hypothetical protein GO988_11355 [Hymenobacter sp. HMF4947]|uniref:Uncharacterized protein n=1 Tax=Hymenobacter ginkgonis TaxID=2682976 RepID=A0A7K1TFJ2_9BACT|nr:hypothetical protein [Hymenobacter ginkgonis]MVN76921.1 hypothetical protein [Hymenobacter ginkgonis]
MCECKKKNQIAAVKYIEENFGGTLRVSSLAASLVNEAALKVDNVLVAVGFDEYEVWVMPIKKDGSVGNSKKRRIPFIHSFCPHCGEKVA